MLPEYLPSPDFGRMQPNADGLREEAGFIEQSGERSHTYIYEWLLCSWPCPGQIGVGRGRRSRQAVAGMHLARRGSPCAAHALNLADHYQRTTGSLMRERCSGE
jgi:hypothetical protein